MPNRVYEALDVAALEYGQPDVIAVESTAV